MRLSGRLIFLGKRRDEKMTAFLEKYKQHLREPDRGPFVSSVEFLTPFALAVLQSKDRSIGYSAQQAAEEHRGVDESVVVNIEVLFTESRSADSAACERPPWGATGFAFRSSDFWRDIDVQVIVKDK